MTDTTYDVIDTPDANTVKTKTPIGRMYSIDNYNVKSRRQRPQYDITNEIARKRLADNPDCGATVREVPEDGKCHRCHRAWTILPYYDESGAEVNLSIDNAVRDLTMRLNRRTLKLCDMCFHELERRRNAE